MAKIRVPYLVSLPRGNKTLYYWQPSKALRDAGWAAKRLSDDRHEAIEEAERLNDALAGWRMGRRPEPSSPAPVELAKLPVDRAAPGTVDEMIRAYKASRHFSKLAAKTQRDYTQCLDRIAAWAGDKPRLGISPKMVSDFYTKLAANAPAMAAAIVRVGQVLYSRGRLLDMVDERTGNPFARQNLDGVGGTGLVWPRAAIDWFVQVADAVGRPSIGTAVLVNSWLGQRAGDVLRLGRGILAKGGRATRQVKTGSVVRLPAAVVPQVAERLEWQMAENDRRAEARAVLDKTAVHSTLLFLDERTGQPWNEHTFRGEFAAVRAIAAETLEASPFEIDWLRPGKDQLDNDAYSLFMDELQFMHLRHTAVVYLAEAGVDILGIAAITGHEPKTCQEILKIYAVKTGRIAEAALRQRMAYEAGQAEG